MRKEQFVSERRERDFTGVFIPSKLYLTNKFSPREKFLLVEIHSLRKEIKAVIVLRAIGILLTLLVCLNVLFSQC